MGADEHPVARASAARHRKGNGPVIAPAMQEETDPARIDAELRRLIGERNHWDESFGRLLMVFKSLGLWRDAGFASFGHYCAERLGISVHHILLRSQGGTDDEWNLISLCAVHHLRGVHGGYIRLSGRAPDELVWELTRAS